MVCSRGTVENERSIPAKLRLITDRDVQFKWKMNVFV